MNHEIQIPVNFQGTPNNALLNQNCAVNSTSVVYTNITLTSDCWMKNSKKEEVLFEKGTEFDCVTVYTEMRVDISNGCKIKTEVSVNFIKDENNNGYADNIFKPVASVMTKQAE